MSNDEERWKLLVVAVFYPMLVLEKPEKSMICFSSVQLNSALFRPANTHCLRYLHYSLKKFGIEICHRGTIDVCPFINVPVLENLFYLRPACIFTVNSKEKSSKGNRMYAVRTFKRLADVRSSKSEGVF